MKTVNSSFWFDELDDEEFIKENFRLDEARTKNYNIYKLASTQRAISNFVSIVTNQNIPVEFNQRGESYTDGSSVVISSNITEPKDFDVAVGLALHEGSHIKLSDFNLLRELDRFISKSLKEKCEHINNTTSDYIDLEGNLKSILNWIEDRRIDYYVYSNSPGYREYYRKMYDKYFNDKLIDKALLSSEYTDPTWESYLFRLINLHNLNSNLDALPNLRKIYKTIDLQNISRFKTTTHTLGCAMEVFEIILDSIIDNGGNQSKDKSGNQNPKESDDGMETSLDSDLGSQGASVSEEGDLVDFDSSSSFQPSTELTNRQKQLIEKKIQRQKDFLDGDISKKSLTKKDIEKVKLVGETNSQIKRVEIEGDKYNYGGTILPKFDVITVKNFTPSLAKSSMFPMSYYNYWKDEVSLYSEQSVNEGIRLGRILGNKLQVRSEERNTIYNRQRSGRIDKRMIASLGFGNENVFSHLEIDKFKKVNLHISIDASGSMAGGAWNKAMINVVALAKACDMIPNLEIQISFRTTTQDNPYVLLAYDSNKDKFSKVKQLFPYLSPNGTTPESICYEAIMDEFIESNNDRDSYFINISDGQPNFRQQSTNSYYYYDNAPRHCKKMMKTMESMGIQIMSYFVSSNWTDSMPEVFTQMYGKYATHINIDSIGEITKTMNKLFLQKV